MSPGWVGREHGRLCLLCRSRTKPPCTWLSGPWTGPRCTSWTFWSRTGGPARIGGWGGGVLGVPEGGGGCCGPRGWDGPRAAGRGQCGPAGAWSKRKGPLGGPQATALVPGTQGDTRPEKQPDHGPHSGRVACPTSEAHGCFGGNLEIHSQSPLLLQARPGGALGLGPLEGDFCLFCERVHVRRECSPVLLWDRMGHRVASCGLGTDWGARPQGLVVWGPGRQWLSAPAQAQQPGCLAPSLPLRHPWWPKSGHPSSQQGGAGPPPCSRSECHPPRSPSVPGAHCSLSLSRSPASGNLDRQTGKGSTALHYCCLTDNAECLKLLLRGKASIEIGERPAASRLCPRGDTGTVGMTQLLSGLRTQTCPPSSRGPRHVLQGCCAQDQEQPSS